jgi:hypothetical protein
VLLYITNPAGVVREFRWVDVILGGKKPLLVASI